MDNNQSETINDIMNLLEGKRLFWLEIINGQTAVIFQNGVEEKVWQQRFRHHGSRKHVNHYRAEATYSHIEVANEVGKVIIRRFYDILDRFSYEAAERDEAGRVTYASLKFQR